MTEEIVIFDRTTHGKTAGDASSSLLAAIDRAAGQALQAVAGNKKETKQVRRLLGNVRAIAASDGRDAALQYMANVQTL